MRIAGRHENGTVHLSMDKADAITLLYGINVLKRHLRENVVDAELDLHLGRSAERDTMDLLHELTERLAGRVPGDAPA